MPSPLPEPHYQDATVTLHAGDCLDVLRGLPDASVDAVVTDPPYGLEFMGKEWDKFDRKGPASFENMGVQDETGRRSRDPNGTSTRFLDKPRHSTMGPLAMRAFQSWCELWAAECLRVLKPGGHLLAFGGTRTFHRLACAIEDAGFEIRDSISWLYGSGFPKSLDVSKAIDRARNDKAEVLGVTSRLADLAYAAGITRGDIDERMGTSDMGGWWLSRLPHRCACPSVENWTRLRDLIPGAHELDAEVWRLNGRKGTPGEAWGRRPITQAEARPLVPGDVISFDQRSSTERERRDIPATDDARTWQGWGTALKPGWEPIVVARKPLVGTVAANVLAHGTGALNVDACRIDTNGETWGGNEANAHTDYSGKVYGQFGKQYAKPSNPAGRWPANVILDSDAAAELDQQSGEASFNPSGTFGKSSGGTVYGNGSGIPAGASVFGYGDQGGASRFFYTAKADAGERVRVDGVAHPTVKPLSLMRWLVRLVTPPGGVVLEPFAGSGTTVEACILEGFRCVAIEREPTYLPLIVQRVNRQRDPIAYTRSAGEDLGLFGQMDGLGGAAS